MPTEEQRLKLKRGLVQLDKLIRAAQEMVLKLMTMRQEISDELNKVR